MEVIFFFDMGFQGPFIEIVLKLNKEEDAFSNEA